MADSFRILQQKQMTLLIRPIQANLTRDTEVITKMDPYCTIKLGQQSKSTRVNEQGGKTPKWTDVLAFNQINYTFITVQVWDKDIVEDDLIGEGTLNIAKVYSYPNVKQSQVVQLKYKGKSSGRVQLALEFQGNLQGMNQGIMMNQQGVMNQGMNQMGQGVNLAMVNPGMNQGMAYNQGIASNQMGQQGFNPQNMGYPQNNTNVFAMNPTQNQQALNVGMNLVGIQQQAQNSYQYLGGNTQNWGQQMPNNSNPWTNPQLMNNGWGPNPPGVGPTNNPGSTGWGWQ